MLRPPRARRRRAGRGERRYRAASRRWATSRAQCCPPAQSPVAGAASIVTPVRCDRQRRDSGARELRPRRRGGVSGQSRPRQWRPRGFSELCQAVKWLPRASRPIQCTSTHGRLKPILNLNSSCDSCSVTASKSESPPRWSSRLD